MDIHSPYLKGMVVLIDAENISANRIEMVMKKRDKVSNKFITAFALLAVIVLTGCDGIPETVELNRDNTVTGIDVNANGVRDEIDAYIASLSDSIPQKAALTQVSSALTNAMLVDVTDENALNAAMNIITNSVTCVDSRYNAATNITMGRDKGDLIRNLTINTKTRFLAYERFNAAMSGHTFSLPEGDGCVD